MNNQDKKKVRFHRLLLILMFHVIIVSTGCSPTNSSASQNKNESVGIDENHQKIDRVNAEGKDTGDLIERDFYEMTGVSLENFVKKRISTTLGLPPMVETDRPEEFEFRLWTDLVARPDPRVLGFRSSGSKNSAYFFEFNRNGYAIKSHIAQLDGPKSGWLNMTRELRTRLTTPKGLVRDPQFDLMRDEPVILLEVFDKGEYRRVFYGQKTSFPDGKRLIEVCSFLAYELGVSMDCDFSRDSY